MQKLNKIDSADPAWRSSDLTVDVTVIIVSWNVADLLERCVESIGAAAGRLRVEIIVVDNASTDSTVQMLQARFPWVHLIVNTENQGFARANNQALPFTTGRFVLFLNPDTIVTEGALEKMSNFLIEHSEVGMVGPRLSYPNGEVQETCARLLPTLTWSLLCDALQLSRLPMIGTWFSRRYIYPYDYSKTQEVEVISGAAMLVRSDVMRKIEGFGESFRHCGEDVDLCFRITKAGWKTYYLCDALVTHFSGQSSQQAPVRTSINSVLSIQQYFNRCFGTQQGFFYRLITQGIQVPLMILIGAARILLGLEPGHKFRQRLEIAKGIWSWQEVE